MAVYKIFPEKDATIYSIVPDMNTGLDPILETTLIVGNNYNPNPQASRILVKFNLDDIPSAASASIVADTYEAYLKMYSTAVYGLSSDTTLLIYAVSGSWDMGTGMAYDIPNTTNGVSWRWKNYSGSEEWIPNVYTGSYSVTGSYDTIEGGGTWYNHTSMSQTFNYYQDKDVYVALSQSGIVKDWIDGTIDNNGFIIKFSEEFINNVNKQPTLQFYGRDTETIYSPYLELKWDDYVYNTSSLLTISDDFITNIKEYDKIYYQQDIVRFEIFARPKYPIRVWQTSSVYNNNYYLPVGSQYAIKDVFTEEYIVNFDSTYTLVSANESGSYFDLYMNGLEPQRLYKILLKVNGNIIDNNMSFKTI